MMCDVVDVFEIFDYVWDINDFEYLYLFEWLNVVGVSVIECDDVWNWVWVEFMLMVLYCSMATFIGLSIRVKLLRTLSRRFKVDVVIVLGMYVSERVVNK